MSSTSDPALATPITVLFNAATHHASAAMSQWTHGAVTLSLDEVLEAPLEELAGQMEFAADLMTMVVLGVEGAGGGQLILVFENESGRRLAASLLRKEVSPGDEWSALEQSAVMETGNILASAYLNELTRLTGCDLTPSAPYFVQDFGASVLEQALVAQAMLSDQVVLCQTRFQFNQQAVNWNVYFVPSRELMDAVSASLRSI